MYLSKLSLTNFRSFREEDIVFEQDLTVLVGENNGGKSNIIDSIRLISKPLSSRRELYCERTDIRFGVTPQRYEIQATFEKLSPPQQGRLLSATTNDTLEQACFGLTYDAENKASHIHPTLWAGRFKATPEPGSLELVRHVYLPPLRDAKRALASGNPTRIYALLNHFLGEQDPKEVAKTLSRVSEHQILAAVDDAVSTGLEALTAGVRRQGAALNFNTEEKLIDIARDLRFKLADHGITPEDLQYSGHGFANLLYIATIAVELERSDDAELTMFLVEEPEAHLHPQLQAAVLNFLEEQAEKSRRPKHDENAPAGHLQVIVATHSPNLSAWVPNDKLVYVRSSPPMAKQSGRDTTITTDEPQSTETPSRPESRCIPLAKLDLTPQERRKIDRYLDVTKSALLFGGRVLLVEGIAEALLLPVFAKQFVLKGRQEDLRKFRSAVFVPIDSVDFLPYLKVLLASYNGVRIADRLVIVTDGDKHKASDQKGTPGEKRFAELTSIAAANNAADCLDVIVNTYSLETELVEAGNADLLKYVYLKLHQRSANKWYEAVAHSDTNKKAIAIQELFESTLKGDFAHLLAEKVTEMAEKNEEFFVPPYITKAIEALVK